ncbi:helix-turn-helix domain-containing protein [Oscillibacter sp. PC13]|uniref:helix-turn-helix domain-containing protein n=1 Tax=Oscillibacter sp. PC13 TaxID=1855299 RepID=UPI001FA829CC|nr:helix-turn-helix domain-containing protein [Oscillibacter sp. PC13]
MKRDVSKYRFALPNDIWTRTLKPPAFAVLAYLQYRHCRKFSSVITLEELTERTRMSAEMAKACVESLINHKLLTVELVPILPNIKGGKFFTVPDEVFYLRLGHGAIMVYAYLLCCEDRRSHQCHPIYKTISTAVGLSINTVMKHINKLAERQFISVERTSYIDNNGMKWNGNNLYTILPIQQVVDAFYQQQLDRLENTAERQRVTKLLREQESPA